MTAALAKALLHFVWEGSAIALLLAIAVHVAQSARMRYALTCVALLAMPVAFLITLMIFMPQASKPLPTMPVFWPSPSPVHITGSSPVAPQRDPSQWLVLGWIAGVGCLFLYKLAGWIGTQRLRRVGVCAASAEWQERLAVLAERMRIARPVALLESCLVDTPVVTGILKPMVLAPLGLLAGLPSEQVEWILIHELAHIRRHDYLVNLAQSVIEGLLFYHPAVWWVSSVVRGEREFCCDDLVVEIVGDARGYAETLGVLEQRRVIAREMALAANGGNLMRRIRRLLGQPEPSRTVAGPVVGLVLLSACVAMAGYQKTPATSAPAIPIMAATRANEKPHVVTAQVISPRTPTTSKAQPQVKEDPRKWLPGHAVSIITDKERAAFARLQIRQQPLASPYRKWLNEDVIYLITNEERDAFEKLQTDPEREMFIDQFWLRRDPTPGTEKNEMKEEHYRRIAWTNDRYSVNGTPGWATDRGKVYIRYGPPDEVETRATPTPSEIWTYRYIEGLNTSGFLSQSKDGQNYQLNLGGGAVKATFVQAIPNGDFILTSPLRAENRGSGRLMFDQFDRLLAFASLNEPAANLGNEPPTTTVDGRLELQVTVTPGSGEVLVTVTLPPSRGPYHVDFRVSNSAGRRVGSPREEEITRTQGFDQVWTAKERFFAPQGRYRLTVAAKDIGTGRQGIYETEFQLP